MATSDRCRPPGRPQVGAATFLFAFATGVATVGGCSSEPRPPDVLLVSLDTVRADALAIGNDGGAADMSKLRRFAEENWYWTRAYAPMAFTLPSHMSLLTGMHPESHAVTIEKSRLSDAIPTLAEILRRHGYATSAFVTSSWLKSEFGFGRGFDVYEELPVQLTFAPRVTDRVLSFLTPASARPRFVFAHYYDAHSDFSSSADNELSYYSPTEYRQDLHVPRSVLCDASDACATERLLRADNESIAVPAVEVAMHRELYRRGLRYLDDQIAELFDRLRRLPIWRRLIVVVVSDHGEEFREHGRFLHSQVYEESLHIPVIVRVPASPTQRRTEELTEIEDVAPTVLGLVGIESPTPWSGRDLGAQGVPRLAGLVGEDKLVRSTYSLRTDDDLLVWDFNTHQSRLFDLADDPAELRPREDEEERLGELRTRLFRRLRELRGRRPSLAKRPDIVFDDEERQVLHSLGYL